MYAQAPECKTCHQPNPNCSEEVCYVKTAIDFTMIVAGNYEPDELEPEAVEYLQDVLNYARNEGMI